MRGSGRSVCSDASTSASERAASSISNGSLGAAADTSRTIDMAISTVDCEHEMTSAAWSVPLTSMIDSSVSDCRLASISLDWRGNSLDLKKTACTLCSAPERTTRKQEEPLPRMVERRPRTVTSSPG
eukprot:scaffold87479_cov33-Tisochrysis_lutea.AAC.3